MILIDGHTMEDAAVDPAIHKFIGMFRKPYVIQDCFVQCTCGSILTTQRESREHYQSGHWDIPQYLTMSPVSKETITHCEP